MSLGKLCLFTILVVVVALAVRWGGVQAKEIDVGIPNSRPQSTVASLDASPWYTGRQSSQPVRAKRVFDAKMDNASSVFLPVQSRNSDDIAAGKLLVASRALGDPSFAETVILVVRCDADGVVGLILNRRTDIPLSEVLEQFEAAKGRSDRVYLGGPVETPAVFALLRSTAKLDGAEQVLSGLYWISKKAPFEKTISGRPDPANFHVYLGYAGWSKDQLRREIKQGSWFIFQGDLGTVFDSDPNTLWHQLIQKTEFQFADREPAKAQFQASS